MGGTSSRQRNSLPGLISQPVVTKPVESGDNPDNVKPTTPLMRFLDDLVKLEREDGGNQAGTSKAEEWQKCQKVAKKHGIEENYVHASKWLRSTTPDGDTALTYALINGLSLQKLHYLTLLHRTWLREWAVLPAQTVKQHPRQSPFIAALKGNCDIFTLLWLLDNNVILRGEDVHGYSALHHLLQLRLPQQYLQTALVLMLNALEKDLNGGGVLSQENPFQRYITAASSTGGTPLHMATLEQSSPAIFRILSQYGAHILPLGRLADLKSYRTVAPSVSGVIRDQSDLLGTSLHSKSNHKLVTFFLSSGLQIPITLFPSRHYFPLIRWYHSLPFYQNSHFFSLTEALADHPHPLIANYFRDPVQTPYDYTLLHQLPGENLQLERAIGDSNFYKFSNLHILGLSSADFWTNQDLIPYIINWQLFNDLAYSSPLLHNLYTPPLQLPPKPSTDHFSPSPSTPNSPSTKSQKQTSKQQQQQQQQQQTQQQTTPIPFHPLLGTISAPAIHENPTKFELTQLPHELLLDRGVDAKPLEHIPDYSFYPSPTDSIPLYNTVSTGCRTHSSALESYESEDFKLQLGQVLELWSTSSKGKYPHPLDLHFPDSTNDNGTRTQLKTNQLTTNSSSNLLLSPPQLLKKPSMIRQISAFTTTQRFEEETAKLHNPVNFQRALSDLNPAGRSCWDLNTITFDSTGLYYFSRNIHTDLGLEPDELWELLSSTSPTTAEIPSKNNHIPTHLSSNVQQFLKQYHRLEHPNYDNYTHRDVSNVDISNPRPYKSPLSPTFVPPIALLQTNHHCHLLRPNLPQTLLQTFFQTQVIPPPSIFPTSTLPLFIAHPQQFTSTKGVKPRTFGTTPTFLSAFRQSNPFSYALQFSSTEEEQYKLLKQAQEQSESPFGSKTTLFEIEVLTPHKLLSLSSLDLVSILTSGIRLHNPLLFFNTYLYNCSLHNLEYLYPPPPIAPPYQLAAPKILSSKDSSSTPNSFFTWFSRPSLFTPSQTQSYGLCYNFRPQMPPGLIWYALLYSPITLDEFSTLLSSCHSDVTNHLWQTTLMYSFLRAVPIECLEHLVRTSQNINQQDVFARTALHYYALSTGFHVYMDELTKARGGIDFLHELFWKNGAYCDIIDVYHQSPLTYAIYNQCQDDILTLLMDMTVSYTPIQLESESRFDISRYFGHHHAVSSQTLRNKRKWDLRMNETKSRLQPSEYQAYLKECDPQSNFINPSFSALDSIKTYLPNLPSAIYHSHVAVLGEEFEPFANVTSQSSETQLLSIPTVNICNPLAPPQKYRPQMDQIISQQPSKTDKKSVVSRLSTMLSPPSKSQHRSTSLSTYNLSQNSTKQWTFMRGNKILTNFSHLFAPLFNNEFAIPLPFTTRAKSAISGDSNEESDLWKYLYFNQRPTVPAQKSLSESLLPYGGGAWRYFNGFTNLITNESKLSFFEILLRIAPPPTPIQNKPRTYVIPESTAMTSTVPQKAETLVEKKARLEQIEGFSENFDQVFVHFFALCLLSLRILYHIIPQDGQVPQPKTQSKKARNHGSSSSSSPISGTTPRNAAISAAYLASSDCSRHDIIKAFLYHNVYRFGPLLASNSSLAMTSDTSSSFPSIPQKVEVTPADFASLPQLSYEALWSSTMGGIDLKVIMLDLQDLVYAIPDGNNPKKLKKELPKNIILDEISRPFTLDDQPDGLFTTTSSPKSTEKKPQQPQPVQIMSSHCLGSTSISTNHNMYSILYKSTQLQQQQQQQTQTQQSTPNSIQQLQQDLPAYLSVTEAIFNEQSLWLELVNTFFLPLTLGLVKRQDIHELVVSHFLDPRKEFKAPPTPHSYDSLSTITTRGSGWTPESDLFKHAQQRINQALPEALFYANLWFLDILQASE